MADVEAAATASDASDAPAPAARPPLKRSPRAVEINQCVGCMTHTGMSVLSCVEIKMLRRVRAVSPRLRRRHRRGACSIA